MRGVPQEFTAGSKRGLEETVMVVRHFDACYGLSVSEAQPKRDKHRGRCKSCRSNGRTYIINISIYHKDKSKNYFYVRIEYIIKQVIRIPGLHCSWYLMPGNEVCKHLASVASEIKGGYLPNLNKLWWLLKKKRTVSANRGVKMASKGLWAGSWDSLPNDLQDRILSKVEFRGLFRFKVLSKSCKGYVESEAFSQWRRVTSSSEGLFTAINYYIKDKAWRCTGFDLQSKAWKTLPPFSPTLPTPEAELFKEYSVCGHGGLICANIAKLPKKGELVVFNPMTRKTFALPPLLNPRIPVLVHMLVDSKTKSYKVMVAGSSTASDEHLSKKMEVFDSKTSKWIEAVDLPGPAFGLNDFQSGVCLNGVLYFIAFLEGACGRGVVAFDVEKRKWLDNMTCPIPFSSYSNTLQLVETNGNVYLFSEQEQGGSIHHCVDVLELSNPEADGLKRYIWTNVVRVKKSGGRGLQVYPEYTCVNFGDGKLCVFNTLNRDGVVYDIQDGRQVEVLEPPPSNQKGENFFSLNPASFTLQPSYDSDPIPPVNVTDL